MSLMYAWLVPSCSISEIALVSLSEPNLSSSSSFPKMRNTSISHFENQLEWKKRLDESWKLEAFFRDICQRSECSNRVSGWDKWKLDHSKNSGHLPGNDGSPWRKSIEEVFFRNNSNFDSQFFTRSLFTSPDEYFIKTIYNSQEARGFGYRGTRG